MLEDKLAVTTNFPPDCISIVAVSSFRLSSSTNTMLFTELLGPQCSLQSNVTVSIASRRSTRSTDVSSNNLNSASLLIQSTCADTSVQSCIVDLSEFKWSLASAIYERFKHSPKHR